MVSHGRVSWLAALSLFVVSSMLADDPVERWVKAAGGREKLAEITATYREATVEWGGYEGTIKVWRTPDGRYRKEERIATLSLIETYDGTTAMQKQNDGPPRELTGPELARARSTAFANTNAVFFAFFPERRRGTVVVEDGAIVLRPEGGIDWRVALDPETSLPRTMIHAEQGRTITVTFADWETVGGVRFEKELHRASTDTAATAVIRFTKTVLNPPIEAALFTIR